MAIGTSSGCVYFLLQSSESMDELGKRDHADKHLRCLQMPDRPLVLKRQLTDVVDSIRNFGT